MTYAVTPAVDEPNITFTKLQSRSLMIAQQKGFFYALICTFTTMFCLESVNPNDNYEEGEVVFMSVGFMRIDVTNIDHHIRDKGYAPGDCFDRLGVDDQKVAAKEIATYAGTLVKNLIIVKAERDETILLLDKDVLAVMPQQLNVCPFKFIKYLLNAYHARLDKLCMLEQVEELETIYPKTLDHLGPHQDVRRRFRRPEGD